jgi:hypothetical protein
MSWSGGTYRKGNYATNGWTGDASLGIGIEAGRHDTQDDDFASGINNCLTKDGTNTPTTNLPMGGFKHTNCGAASADTDYTTLGDVKAGISTQSTALTINNTAFSNDNVGPRISLRKSRGATVGTNTIVQSGDAVGSIGFVGANGTGYDFAALISCEVDGVPGASSDMPGRLKFYTTADGSSSVQERMHINSSGNVGIGITPTYRLHVASPSIAVAGSLIATTTAGDAGINGMIISKTDNVSTAGSNYFIQFYINAGATASGRIASNGANAAAFFSTSDINLKENIVDLPSQLDNILALRPVEFDYKDGSGHQIGFIAQEVEQIYPDNVFTDPSGIKFLGDMSRNDARVIKAIQDLNAKVEALTARVAALEAA